jgi:hypothetical protein
MMDSDRHLIICLLFSIIFNQTGAILWAGLSIAYGVLSVIDGIKAIKEEKK